MPYDPQTVEDKIYEKWEKSGFFNPDECLRRGVAKPEAPVFSIVLPPPNVTGSLHVGHSVMLAIEDIMIRYHRMRGERTLWLPGTDHAAIATQSKVEKILYQKSGQTRHDLGREEFLKQVEAYARASHDTIIKQCKKMGASLDWSREAYTLDEKRSRAVRTAFKKMYEAGLIYRGERIVNWDARLQTTVSDDEIEWREEKTSLYYLKYGPFTIATARPETKFGDKYIVMHPDDPRYQNYRTGQKIEVEWINGPVTATIIKDPVIDMDFGTGVMTITPWHDSTDFDLAERHGLDREPIIDLNGKLLPVAGEFAGLKINRVRPLLIKKLEAKGLVEKIEENYLHRVAVNSRGGEIIEPQILRQWFIAVNKKVGGKSLKERMRAAVETGQIKIIPERFVKIYYHWIDNLRDWCISRQIWYGHRIPVWYRGEDIYCGLELPAGAGWEQDPDTLDTWFSSGLWTFSTLGWPEETSDLKTYHPISVLETGYDILFFWIARMILLTTYLLETVPFQTVYLHGLVRTERGIKMSKSLENALDPLVLIDKYGADALRLALVVGTSPGHDLKLSENRVRGYKNFANKLWNVNRFILQTGPEDPAVPLTTPDQKLFNDWREILAAVTADLDNYRFYLAGEKLYHYTWHVFADKIIEASKPASSARRALLYKIWREILIALHPFMPFVTEEIWSTFNKRLLMIEPWPRV